MRTTSAHGFSLIELLVGIVIALFGSLAIMQAFTGRESDRRAIGSVADAQSNAMISLYLLERELQQAGAGISDLRTLGCQVTSGTSALTNLPIFPVGIVPADGSVNPWKLPMGDANSDMLMLVYGTGEAVQGKSLRADVGAGADSITLVGVEEIRPDDMLLIAEQNQVCTLGRVTATPDYNQELVSIDTPTAAAYTKDNARAFAMGRRMRAVAYAVRNGSLTVCNFDQANCTTGANDPTIWVPIANDIVALHAQYGVDTSAPQLDGQLDAYCQAAGNKTCVAGTTPPPTAACDHARIMTVRLGLVSRSPQAEKNEVSPEKLKIWEDDTQTPTTTGPNWTVPDRHYRYGVISTSIALRNMQLMSFEEKKTSC